MNAPHPRRLDPLPGDAWDDSIREALSSLLPADRANPRDAGNMLATMAQHPALLRAYLPFNAYLLRESTLTPRVREIALLRVVSLRGCDYLWSHHVPLAHRAGLSDTEIGAIRDGALPGDDDQAVLRVVDDLNAHGTISAAGWDELGRHFSTQQRMDLVFTVGGYYLLAMAVNAFGIEVETI